MEHTCGNCYEFKPDGSGVCGICNASDTHACAEFDSCESWSGDADDDSEEPKREQSKN